MRAAISGSVLALLVGGSALSQPRTARPRTVPPPDSQSELSPIPSGPSTLHAPTGEERLRPWARRLLPPPPVRETLPRATVDENRGAPMPEGYWRFDAPYQITIPSDAIQKRGRDIDIANH